MRPALVYMLFFWALISYGQNALIPNPRQLPTVSSPSIPTPQYDLLRSQQSNTHIVEQEQASREAYKDLENDNNFGLSRISILGNG